jgi:hypothetical protein
MVEVTGLAIPPVVTGYIKEVASRSCLQESVFLISIWGSSFFKNISIFKIKGFPEENKSYRSLFYLMLRDQILRRETR